MTAAAEAVCLPRFMTPRSPERPTLGGRVADIAQALGKPFMPWQRLVADLTLEIDIETGLPAFDSVVLVVGRQQGKSEFLLPLMTHRSLGFDRALVDWIGTHYGLTPPVPGSQRTMYLAQGADQSRAKWRDVHLPRIQKSALAPLLIDARLRQNQEQMLFKNGSTWVPGSATATTAGTGDTLDLGVIDEAWAHTARTELGMRPTMLTRDWRQLWRVSMVPGPERKKPHEWPYLRQLIADGRAAVAAGLRSGMCYIEFSAPPGLDPGALSTWRLCMPALVSGKVSERAVRSDFRDLPRPDFEAEYLGWEPQVGTPRWEVVPEAIWAARADRDMGRPEPIAIGIEALADQSIATIGIAGLLDGDPDTVGVELDQQHIGLEWVIPRIVDLCETWQVCAIAINPSGGAAGLYDPLVLALKQADISVDVLRPNAREVAAGDARLALATGMHVEEVTSQAQADQPTSARRVTHRRQPILDRSLGSSTRRVFGGLWQFAEAVPGADVAPIKSISLAMWAGDRVEWLGASYAIGESLG